MSDHNLGDSHHVFDGEGKLFTFDGKHAVFNIDGDLFAFEDACKRMGGSLGNSKLEGNLVACPNHGWQYDVTNGKCVTENEYESGCKVDTYPIKVKNNKIILSLP
jgi:nitrite reductase (NADH) small subunit